MMKRLLVVVACLPKGTLTPRVSFVCLGLNVSSMPQSKLEVRYAKMIMEYHDWISDDLHLKPKTPDEAFA
jgi:hypothetical protein